VELKALEKERDYRLCAGLDDKRSEGGNWLHHGLIKSSSIVTFYLL